MQLSDTRHRLRYSILAALLCSGIIAGTYIRLPLPIGIPVTFQVPMIQVAALGLPAPFGILAITLYLALGAFGFPVFSKGGGISYFFEITGGYLIGFWIATFLCQIFQKQIIQHWISIFAALIVHSTIIYLLGISWQAHVTNSSWLDVAVAMTPFILTSIPKIILALLMIIGFQKALSRKF